MNTKSLKRLLWVRGAKLEPCLESADHNHGIVVLAPDIVSDNGGPPKPTTVKLCIHFRNSNN